MPVRFGEFSLDRDRRLLSRGDEPVPLARKAFDFLDLLVAERPRALSKEQIRDRVWPKTVVSESTAQRPRRGAAGGARGRPAHAALHPHRPRLRLCVRRRGLRGDGRGEAPAASAAGSPALLTARLLWEDRLIPLSPGRTSSAATRT